MRSAGVADLSRSARLMKSRETAKGATLKQVRFLTKRTVLLKKTNHRSKKVRFAIRSPIREGKYFYCAIEQASGSKHRLAGVEPLQAVLNGLRFIVLDLSRLESHGWRISSLDGKRKIHWRHYFDVAALKEIRKKRKPNKTPQTTPGSSASLRV